MEGVEDVDEGEGKPAFAGVFGEVVAEGMVVIFGIAMDCVYKFF